MTDAAFTALLWLIVAGAWAFAGVVAMVVIVVRAIRAGAAKETTR